ncbi:hypothetical protein H0H93_012869, partial [Arthromyces matolae]
ATVDRRLETSVQTAALAILIARTLKVPRYVEQLETRLEKLEKLLTKLYPDSDILKVIDSFDDTEACLTKHFPRPNPEKSDNPLASTTQRSYDIATSVIRKVAQPQPLESEAEVVDDFADVKLANVIANLRIRDVGKNRFFGKSSGAMLIRAAMELKKEATGTNNGGQKHTMAPKREEFWTAQPWETECLLHDVPDAAHRPSYVFPPEDLMMDLIDLYFSNANLFLPLLHRPTFEKALAEKLHLRDEGFAVVLLLVCAVASRYSDDPRTLIDGVQQKASAGWKWYHQVQLSKKNVLASPLLYDLQYYCVHPHDNNVGFSLG